MRGCTLFGSSRAGNSLLLNAPTAHCSLPACMLAMLPGKCNNVDCGLLIGWSADKCFDK